ncbi:MAG: radical SAM protein [Christensenellales bacterium]|nr:radical SAM protein [Christensenellales bacterium]
MPPREEIAMPPLSLLVKPVSGLCNMRCPYCFYADEMRRREVALRGPMTPDTAEKIVRRAFAFADGEVAFAFQGGEPTLAGAAFYWQWLRLEARHNARRLRVRHTLQTNGLQISEELLEVFVQGRFLLGVSLDGTKALHDARRRARRNMRGRRSDRPSNRAKNACASRRIGV